MLRRSFIKTALGAIAGLAAVKTLPASNPEPQMLTDLFPNGMTISYKGVPRGLPYFVDQGNNYSGLNRDAVIFPAPAADQYSWRLYVGNESQDFAALGPHFELKQS